MKTNRGTLKRQLPIAVSASAVAASRRAHRRMTAAIALAAVAAAMLVPVGQAALPREERVSTEEYVPFVTDFPKPVASTATAEPFVPFVTDFPQVASASAPAADRTIASGIDWGEVGIGSGVGSGIVALLAGSWLVLTRRARLAQS